MYLHDDISTYLDAAMMVRRDGIHGEKTPDGILTRFKGTPFAKIIKHIEHQPDPVAINLGLMLLQLDEDTINKINKYIIQILKKTTMDGRLHGMTIGISEASCGFTIYCSLVDDSKVTTKLRTHCAMRKYSQKADHWFGIVLRPDGSIHFLTELKQPWIFNQEMETIVANSLSVRPLNMENRKKVGRNNPCPCGSGKKYKDCCINRK